RRRHGNRRRLGLRKRQVVGVGGGFLGGCTAAAASAAAPHAARFWGGFVFGHGPTLSHGFARRAGCENPGMAPSVHLFDLEGRGSVVLTGKDRATFLHGLVTNDVKKLTPGAGCAAAFLTAKGKLLAECVVLCEDDRLVLDTPPELAATVEDLLRKYLVFNDVTITNETEGT